MAEVTNTEVPKFDGHAGSFANYEEDVNFRKRMSAMGPERKAAHLPPHISDVARRVCLSVGRGVFGDLDSSEQILKIPRGRLAPDATASTFQDTVKFLRFRRTWTRT